VSVPQIDVFLKPDTLAPDVENVRRDRSRSESCAKIKGLGFTVSRHIKMYGEEFEIVSDPFSEGDGVAVRATSGNDPKVRTLRLPTAILVGSKERFLKIRSVAGHASAIAGPVR
jgi:hypothetical protein